MDHRIPSHNRTLSDVQGSNKGVFLMNQKYQPGSSIISRDDLNQTQEHFHPDRDTRKQQEIQAINFLKNMDEFSLDVDLKKEDFLNFSPNRSRGNSIISISKIQAAPQPKKKPKKKFLFHYPLDQKGSLSNKGLPQVKQPGQKQQKPQRKINFRSNERAFPISKTQVTQETQTGEIADQIITQQILPIKKVISEEKSQVEVREQKFRSDLLYQHKPQYSNKQLGGLSDQKDSKLNNFAHNVIKKIYKGYSVKKSEKSLSSQQSSQQIEPEEPANPKMHFYNVLRRNSDLGEDESVLYNMAKETMNQLNRDGSIFKTFTEQPLVKEAQKKDARSMNVSPIRASQRSPTPSDSNRSRLQTAVSRAQRNSSLPQKTSFSPSPILFQNESNRRDSNNDLEESLKVMKSSKKECQYVPPVPTSRPKSNFQRQRQLKTSSVYSFNQSFYLSNTSFNQQPKTVQQKSPLMGSPFKEHDHQDFVWVKKPAKYDDNFHFEKTWNI